MKLLEDIIESVTVSKEPVSDILRRCLVLAFKLKNETLKAWVEHELNGYGNTLDLPEYRRSAGVAKGLFPGGYGAELRDQPLAASILKPEHQHFANEIRLAQPIAAYEGAKNEQNAALPWPADLVAMYQSKFIEHYALNRAWMEIPGSVFTGLIDTVRTRILSFVLEIQAALPENNEKAIDKIEPATIERLVQVTIFGGNNVIGNVGDFNAQSVIAGDLNSLKKSLKAMNVEDLDIESLETILIEDDSGRVQEAKPKPLDQKTIKWITETTKKLGGSAVKIGGKLAEEVIRTAIMKYVGL